MDHEKWPLDATLNDDLRPLEDGQWMILIARRDCDHCRKIIAKYFSHSERKRPGERTAIFVAAGRKWPFQFDRITIEFPVENQVEWKNSEPFVASPAVFIVRDGVVVKAADGNDADLLVQQHLADSRL